jgi:hypothetical protein
MTDIAERRARETRPRNSSVVTHKFPVGASVFHRVGGRSEKVAFKIIRLLPDGGEGLQYRIKGERDGQERVVTEANIER